MLGYEVRHVERHRLDIHIQSRRLAALRKLQCVAVISALAKAEKFIYIYMYMYMCMCRACMQELHGPTGVVN